MTEEFNFDEGINRYLQSASHRVWDSLSMAVNLFTEPNDPIIVELQVFFDLEDATGENQNDETRAICTDKKLLRGHMSQMLQFCSLLWRNYCCIGSNTPWRLKLAC